MEQAGQPLDLFETEQLLPAEELEIAPEDFFGHAVYTAEVAAIGYRDAQVAQRTPERVLVKSLYGFHEAAGFYHLDGLGRLATAWSLAGPKQIIDQGSGDAQV